jgi:hypothetical protein
MNTTMVKKFRPGHYWALLMGQRIGARIVGKLVSDMTFLRDDRLIRPRAPRLNVDAMKQGVVHYEVTFDLVAIIECRNLRYEARYPANNSGKVQKTDQVCIAAAFKPGTG